MAALAVTHRVDVGLDLDQQTLRGESIFDGDPGIEAVEAGEPSSAFVDHPTLVDDTHLLQLVALADLEVGLIVSRSDLHRTGAEGGGDRIVAHDRDLPADQG